MDILRVTDRIGSMSGMSGSGESAVIAPFARQFSRALTRVVGFVWALTMSVAGGLMMLSASEAASWLKPTLLSAGFTGVIAGVFLFQILVVGRVLPMPDPRLARNVEALLGVALLIGIALTALTLLS